ncbi:MAG: type secretion system protein ImpK [Acetobacteraceae bacterium]|nr:type secretion system protein ImpK [Acetobacteraceae bacterium]
MSDNPFDEDSDRTVIRPVPGGTRPARPPASAQFATREPPRAYGAPDDTPKAAAATLTGDPEPIVLGLNPLVTAAAPLLALIGRLSRTYSQPDTVDLRERTMRQIRAFERQAQAGGIAPDLVVKARYVLCATLDDIAQSTEWGRDGVWAARPLIGGFQEGLRGYEGIQSGVGFFRLLDDAKRSPGKELPLLELMYLCISLGFLGELRVSQRPMAALDRIRQDLHTVIVNQRQAPETALSPHWQGEAAPYAPPRAAVPAWVIGAAALALVGGTFVWLSAGLSTASDEVFERMLSAPLAQPPRIVRAQPVLPPSQPSVAAEGPDSLAIFLKPEIDRGLVSVLGDHSRPLIRIRNRGLFGSGSATVSAGYVPLLERIGQALNAERGSVEIGGYTDDQPIHTVQFPSNFQLSAARADAAGAILRRAMSQPGRISTTGHANADPVSPNDTPEGREENRRIEVVLRRQD